MGIQDKDQESNPDLEKKSRSEKNNQRYQNKVADLHSHFQKARSNFRIEFSDASSAFKSTYPLFDESTIKKLLGLTAPSADKQPDNDPGEWKVEHQTKRRLVWFMGAGPDKFIYRLLKKKMAPNNNSDDPRMTVSPAYLGGYRYFRFHENATGANNFIYNYGKGKVLIHDRDGVPMFDHWGVKSKKKPQHSGFVFTNGLYVYMLSMGKDAMRLAIASAGDPASKLFGVVATPHEHEGPSNPLASRFILVPVENTELIQKLSNADKCLDKEGKTSSVGIEEFHSLANGSYSFAMHAFN